MANGSGIMLFNLPGGSTLQQRGLPGLAALVTHITCCHSYVRILYIYLIASVDTF